MRLVFLDTETLGMVANPRGTPRAVQCQQWVRDRLAAGVRARDLSGRCDRDRQARRML